MQNPTGSAPDFDALLTKDVRAELSFQVFEVFDYEHPLAGGACPTCGGALVARESKVHRRDVLRKKPWTRCHYIAIACKGCSAVWETGESFVSRGS